MTYTGHDYDGPIGADLLPPGWVGARRGQTCEREWKGKHCGKPAVGMRHNAGLAVSWTRTWGARWYPVCAEHYAPTGEPVSALIERRPELATLAGAAGVWALEAVRQG